MARSHHSNYLETECGNSEAVPLAGETSALATELAAMRAQMRILRGVAFGSLAVSMVVLALLGHSVLRTSSTGLPGAAVVPPGVIAGTQLWEQNDVIVPYGFKSCDSAAEPPQIAPIRKTGDFLFLSGILGYEVPCKSAVKDVHKQIESAFRWANDTLATAGVSWKDVLSVTSYHVNLDQHQPIFTRMREMVLPAPPYPAWTAVGVKSLYFPHEVFEMTIVARHVCVGLECDR